MKNDINNPLEREANKESNRDPKKLRTIALASLLSVLAVAGYHECSGVQFSDEVPDGKVVEGKEGSNSVAFSCVLNFYRGGGAEPGSYDFNGRINEKNGIYECTIKLKDENSFSYDLLSTFEVKNKDDLEETILGKIRKALPEQPNKNEWDSARNLVEEAIDKLNKSS